MTTLLSDATLDATDAELSAEVGAFLTRSRWAVEETLQELLPAADVAPQVLHKAMRDSVLAGGKRLRPALVLATGTACGAARAQLLRTAAAFELVHTYSLVHDDLPAMDDDDLRRGQPTCHVKYGEATAILVGDALQTLAFQIVAEDETITPLVRVRVLAELARGAGTPSGMVAGQVYDLDAETRTDVTGAELERIHRHKTGALITAAVRCGALIGDASDDDLAALTVYAAALGLLFQITDDILDITATSAELGKTAGKDARADKATYPKLYGLDGAHDLARQQYEKACAALHTLAQPAPLLTGLAKMTLHRRR